MTERTRGNRRRVLRGSERQLASPCCSRPAIPLPPEPAIWSPDLNVRDHSVGTKGSPPPHSGWRRLTFSPTLAFRDAARQQRGTKRDYNNPRPARPRCPLWISGLPTPDSRRSLRQATYPQPPNTRKRHPAELYQALEGSRLRAKWGAQLRAI